MSKMGVGFGEAAGEWCLERTDLAKVVVWARSTGRMVGWVSQLDLGELELLILARFIFIKQVLNLISRVEIFRMVNTLLNSLLTELDDSKVALQIARLLKEPKQALIRAVVSKVPRNVLVDCLQ